MIENFSSKDAFTWSPKQELGKIETWEMRNKQNFDRIEAGGEINFAVALVLINGILKEVAEDVNRNNTSTSLFSPRNDDVPFMPGLKGREDEVGGTFGLTKKDLSNPSEENSSTVYVEVAKNPLQNANFTATTGITIYSTDRTFYSETTGSLNANIIDLLTDPERETEFKNKLGADFKNACEITNNAATLLNEVKNRKREQFKKMDEFNQERRSRN